MSVVREIPKQIYRVCDLWMAFDRQTIHEAVLAADAVARFDLYINLRTANMSSGLTKQPGTRT